jgi:hypothetical protein
MKKTEGGKCTLHCTLMDNVTPVADLLDNSFRKCHTLKKGHEVNQRLNCKKLLPASLDKTRDTTRWKWKTEN